MLSGRYLKAVSDDLTPEQRRLVRRAQEVIADRRMQEGTRAAQRSLTVNRRLVQMTQGLVDAVAPTLHMVSAALNSWLSQIDWERVRSVLRTVGDVIASLLPPNARALGAAYWPDLQRVAGEEQLCLSWVPDAAIARLLLDAPHALERERLLIASSNEVLSTCEHAVRAAVDESPEEPGHEGSEEPAATHEQLAEVAELLSASIEAAKAGHPQAAQALATCVTDTLLEQHVNRRRGRTHTFLKQRLSQADEAQFIGLVIGPTLAAAESSFRQVGTWFATASGAHQGSTPYSRHATVHAACADVFTEATALKAVLLATSVFLLSTNPVLSACFDLLDAKLTVDADDYA